MLHRVYFEHHIMEWWKIKKDFMKKPMAEITLKETLLSRWNNVVFLLSLVLFGLAYAIVFFFMIPKISMGLYEMWCSPI